MCYEKSPPLAVVWGPRKSLDFWGCLYSFGCWFSILRHSATRFVALLSIENTRFSIGLPSPKIRFAHFRGPRSFSEFRSLAPTLCATFGLVQGCETHRYKNRRTCRRFLWNFHCILEEGSMSPLFSVLPQNLRAPFLGDVKKPWTHQKYILLFCDWQSRRVVIEYLSGLRMCRNWQTSRS